MSSVQDMLDLLHCNIVIAIAEALVRVSMRLLEVDRDLQGQGDSSPTRLAARPAFYRHAVCVWVDARQMMTTRMSDIQTQTAKGALSLTRGALH